MRKFLYTTVLLFSLPFLRADDGGYDTLNALVSEGTKIRVRLADERRAAAVENMKRAELEGAYKARIESLEDNLRQLRKRVSEARERAVSEMEKAAQMEALLKEFDAFCGRVLSEILSDTRAVKALSKAGLASPSREDLSQLGASEKYALLRDVLRALLREDSKIVDTNGAKSSGIWTRVQKTQKEISGGVFEAEVVRQAPGWKTGK